MSDYLIEVERDSVCMGDDVDAPHSYSFNVSASSTLCEVFEHLASKRYLASVAGKNHSWEAVIGNKSVALFKANNRQPDTMKSFITFMLGLGMSFMTFAEETWSVGQAKIQGNPVVYKFMNDLPSEGSRRAIPWLTVVSWKYDGSQNDGMPPKEINSSMIKLEDGLEAIEGREKLYFDAYSVTGNNLKEFVFYIADREKFMVNFNKALKGHPAYPIEVHFYEDKEWSELVKLQHDFKSSR